jgi:flagellar biosynthesis/type III secretory pathway protein FliH
LSNAAFQFEPLEAPPVYTEPQHVRVGQASDVLDQAHAEAHAIREAARQEGFQAGFEAGMAQAGERLAPIVSTLSEAHAALGAERAHQAEAVERHAVDLALRIAEKTLGAALEARPEHVVDVVRGGLRRLLERDRVIVLVNPEDMELVRQATSELKATLGGIGELDVQSERRVARGGAIVRTHTGEVDGRLETQLERAREALLEALKGSDVDAEADSSDQIFG